MGRFDFVLQNDKQTVWILLQEIKIVVLFKKSCTMDSFQPYFDLNVYF